MKLQTLKSFEALNKESFSVIVGGALKDSSRYDVGTGKNCKKNDPEGKNQQ
jgi:hypothetical protein|tara:strand:+ start:2816 stop:2968 length:153 start_codon:yes stop_codon:yes gene_type:complete